MRDARWERKRIHVEPILYKDVLYDLGAVAGMHGAFADNHFAHKLEAAARHDLAAAHELGKVAQVARATADALLELSVLRRLSGAAPGLAAIM